MTTFQVLNVPARHPSYKTEVTKTVTFSSIDEALAFAERNGGRLFYLANGVCSFTNLSQRKAEEIIA